MVLVAVSRAAGVGGEEVHQQPQHRPAHQDCGRVGHQGGVDRQQTWVSSSHSGDHVLLVNQLLMDC